MGNFPNLVFRSIHVSWNDGNSKFVGEDSMLFHESRVNKESSCSRAEDDWDINNFILFFCLAHNRKSGCELFISIIGYKYRRESQCF